MSLLPEITIKDVVTDFLGSAPLLAEIVDYRLPEAFLLRAHELLEKIELAAYPMMNAPRWKNFARSTIC